jgi:hypothetical protein
MEAGMSGTEDYLTRKLGAEWREAVEDKAAERLLARLVERQAESIEADAEPITDITFKELLDQPPVKCVVAGLVPCNALVQVFGDRSTKKSFAFGIDLSCQVSSAGDNWLGVPVLEHGPCAYIPGEGKGGVAQRVQAWAKAHPGREPDFHMPKFKAISLLSESDVRRVIAWLRRTADTWVLATIDAQADFMGGDEDSARDTSRLKAALLRIMEEACVCTIIVIAHPGNAAKDRARGSSRQAQAFDTVLRVQPGLIISDEARGGKQRDLTPAGDIEFHTELIQLGKGASSLVVRPGASMSQLAQEYGGSEDPMDGEVIALVRRHPSEYTQAGAYTALGSKKRGHSAMTYRRHVEKLVAKGALTVNTAGYLDVSSDSCQKTDNDNDNDT